MCLSSIFVCTLHSFPLLMAAILYLLVPCWLTHYYLVVCICVCVCSLAVRKMEKKREWQAEETYYYHWCRLVALSCFILYSLRAFPLSIHFFFCKGESISRMTAAAAALPSQQSPLSTAHSHCVYYPIEVLIAHLGIFTWIFYTLFILCFSVAFCVLACCLVQLWWWGGFCRRSVYRVS